MRKKRGFKKRRFRKRRMINPLGRGIPNSRRKIRLDIEASFDVVAQAVAGRQLVQTYFPLNFPGNVVSDAGNFAGAYGNISSLGAASTPTVSRILTQVATTLFDEYKVLRLVVRFIPDANVTRSSGVATANASNVVMMHYNDLDDISLLTTNVEAKYLSNGALPKSYGTSRQAGIQFVFPQPKQKRSRYLNAGQILTQTPGTTVLSSATPFENPFSSMKILFVAQPPTAAQYWIGRVYAKWECIFKGISSTL